jgi:superfamily II DNA/RNA helicase
MTELSEIFSDLPESIQRGIRDLGWNKPMPVQTKVLPLMRSGKDLIM